MSSTLPSTGKCLWSLVSSSFTIVSRSQYLVRGVVVLVSVMKFVTVPALCDGDVDYDGDEDCAQNSHYLLSAAAPSTNQGFGKGLLMMMTVMIVMVTMMLTMMMTALMTAMITNIKIAFQFLIIISCTLPC